MKNGIRKLISVVLCFTLLFSVSSLAFAKSAQSNSKQFKDVKPGHWAYDAIMWMLERSIIDGVGGDRFDPNGIVTRAQFAKMMVNTLNLKKYSPETPSFLDVKKNSWEYPYVESAKPYLTGFRTSSGDYFKPSLAAVREDMAVALVNALGYQGESIDTSILNQFADKDQISPNLRKHVALSVKYGLIVGKTENGRLLFDPQGNLTRAQAAVLLKRAFEKNEEKVTYDEEKVTYDPNTGYTYERPIIELKTENNVQVIRWNRIESDKFREYRVVISKNDDTPQYPDNGYLYTITDRNRTYAVIDNTDKYNGGDFGNYLTKGQTYYISVTAVYSDRNVPGNTVSFVYNGPENPELYVAPDVSSSVENGKLVLRWNRIDSPKLTGYIVSASKNDSTVTYPENGYLYKINDVNRTYAVIDNSTRYTDGDFEGYFINGEQYYFSVTAVYNDKSVTGNTIRCTYVGEDSPELFPAPQVSAAYEDGKLVVKWNKLDSSLLTEYRVVISEKSDKPAYPANGYYDQAYGKDTTSVVIDSAKQYHNGDFEKLTYATEYYISVTAVYGNKYVAGNAVKILYLINDQQAE
ncbi:MAG TPA: S-layer homology domain-containing protein [Clostridiales bacterium]|nr:S-layer homology domain-containing protein [Clostridiales bacterium]